MPSIARLATDLRGRPAVLVRAAPPPLGAARRRLGLVVAWYVLVLSALAALAALANVATTRSMRLPRAPEIGWTDLASAGAVASAAVRASVIGFALAFGGQRRGGRGRRGRRGRRGGRGHSRWAIAGAGALSALAIEIARWLWRLPMRPSVVLAAAAAAVLGALIYEHAFARRRADHALGSVAGRVLPLELPLTGAVLLLVPPLWLTANHPDRLPLVALLACFGASLLSSARLSHGPAAGGAWTHALVSAAWVTIATLPVWLAAPRSAAILAAGVAAFAAAHGFLPPPDATDRRFEGPAVRRALPLLAVFLVADAIWPVPSGVREGLRPAITWGWGTGAARGALAYATTFAVVGYVAAELRGRREESDAAAWRTLVGWVAIAAAGLELLRGLHPDHIAGVGRATVAVVAARLGAAIYACHRDHVRAWRATGGRIRGVAPLAAAEAWAAAARPGRTRR